MKPIGTRSITLTGGIGIGCTSATMHYGTSMSYGFTPAIPLKGRVCARCFTLGNDDSITRDFDKDVLPKKTGFAGRLDGFTRVPCVATPPEATPIEATPTTVRDPRKGDMGTLKRHLA